MTLEGAYSTFLPPREPPPYSHPTLPLSIFFTSARNRKFSKRAPQNFHYVNPPDRMLFPSSHGFGFFFLFGFFCSAGKGFTPALAPFRFHFASLIPPSASRVRFHPTQPHPHTRTTTFPKGPYLARVQYVGVKIGTLHIPRESCMRVGACGRRNPAPKLVTTVLSKCHKRLKETWPE